MKNNGINITLISKTGSTYDISVERTSVVSLEKIEKRNLTAEEIKLLFSDKTYEGYNRARGATYRVYDSANGEHTLINPRGRTVRRYWKVTKNGKFCISSGSQSTGACFYIVNSGNDEYQRVDDDGVHDHTFSKFVNGNQLE